MPFYTLATTIELTVDTAILFLIALILVIISMTLKRIARSNDSIANSIYEVRELLRTGGPGDKNTGTQQ